MSCSCCGYAALQIVGSSVGSHHLPPVSFCALRTAEILASAPSRVIVRLINAETLEFVEFATIQWYNPPYYILSHRWQEGEIPFKDFKKGRRKDSQGYRKVLEFCKSAIRRHRKNQGAFAELLEHPCYIWIDTCCIDKSSSADLSLSINSMWDWYHCAVECHIYLSDVHTSEQGPELDGELRTSSWFKRGWTLQELLAPAGLGVRLLLNSKWEFIGNLKRNDLASLLLVVSKITGIQKNYLSGSRSITKASVACRMSWASGRRTTLTENEAYCLMGIFNINMPLLYGEGHKAFRRLQEEIIRSSTDQSIFASSSTFRLSANGPSYFRGNGNIVTKPHDGNRVAKHMPIQPFEITNLGVRFRAVIRCRRHHDWPKDFWAFQLNCFETSGAENTPSSMYLALEEAIEEDESMGQPLVLRKEAVIRGEKELQKYFRSLEEPIMKTFYVVF